MKLQLTQIDVYESLTSHNNLSTLLANNQIHPLTVKHVQKLQFVAHMQISFQSSNVLIVKFWTLVKSNVFRAQV